MFDPLDAEVITERINMWALNPEVEQSMEEKCYWKEEE